MNRIAKKTSEELAQEQQREAFNKMLEAREFKLRVARGLFVCRDCSAPLKSQEEQDAATMCGDEKDPCPVCGYYAGIESEDEK